MKPDHFTRRDILRVLGGTVLGLPVGQLFSRSERCLAAEKKAGDRQLADEIETTLWKQILPPWYPRALAAEGGFHENFAEDWSPRPEDSKFLVYQARLTWTPAAVARAYPRRGKAFRPYVDHGLKFLAGPMWDGRHGGFYDRLDEQRRPVFGQRHVKQMYAEAFGIYAAAEAYAATGDPAALELAQEAFAFIERAAHDPDSGGYFEHLSIDGRPLTPALHREAAAAGFWPIGRVGQKSMNAHIHILEALTTLARVWNDQVVRERLAEVFEIVRDKIVLGRGHLAMFTTNDFRPLDERNSFGHQLETAYLLGEAADVLGRREAKTGEVARRLVEHSIRFGWDDAHGGFYDEGPPEGPATKRHKVWWVQPEGLNGLLAVPGPDHRELLGRTWSFFREKMIDPRYGGCYEVVEESGRPLPENRHKSSPWKAPYHVARGMMHTIAALRAG